ncbi:MAG: MurR/RpiR family transcriptional regulator [Vibrio sp.]
MISATNQMLMDIMTNSSLLVSIKSQLSSLTRTDRIIAESIVDNPAYFVQVSAKSFANQVGTSDATVIRFCKKMGFSGYQELKEKLKSDLLAPKVSQQNVLTSDIYIDDSIGSTASKLCGIISQSIRDTKIALNLNTIEKIVQRISKCQRIFFIGLGGSGMSALEASLKFNRIGIDANGFNEKHAMFYKLQHTTSDDIVVALSHSGNTEDIVNAQLTAKECGAFTIVITNNLSSPLAEISDIKILNCSEGEVYQGDSIGTRVSQMYILDLIYTELMKRNFDKVKSAKSNIREKLLLTHSTNK